MELMKQVMKMGFRLIIQVYAFVDFGIYFN